MGIDPITADIMDQALASGSLALRNAHAADFATPEAAQAFRDLAASKSKFFGRWVGWGDRVMYSKNLHRLGKDAAYRVAIIEHLNKMGTDSMSQFYKDEIVGKSFRKLSDFGKRYLDEGPSMFKGTGERIDALKMKDIVDGIMGSYNTAELSSTQRRYTRNFFTFYGWNRGTMTTWLSAPINHPIRTFIAPLIAGDMLNYTLSGHHVWDNPVGKKTSIQINPAYMDESYLRGMFASGDVNVDDPKHSYFIDLPSPLRKSLGFANIEGMTQGAQQLAQNQFKNVSSIMAHIAIGAGLKGLQYSVINQAVPSGDMTKAFDILDAFATKSFTETTPKAVEAALGAVNMNLGQMWRTLYQHNLDMSGDMWGELALTQGASILGANVRRHPLISSRKDAAWGLETTGTTDMIPTTEVIKEHALRGIFEDPMSTEGDLGSKIGNNLVGGLMSDRLDAQTNNPLDRARAKNTVRRLQK
jgi:hypothetical protein